MSSPQMANGFRTTPCPPGNPAMAFSTSWKKRTTSSFKGFSITLRSQPIPPISRYMFIFMPIPFLHRRRDNTTCEQLLNKLKTYYASCTNEKELDSKGSEPLLEVTRRIRTLLPDRASGTKHGSQAVFAPKYAHRLTSVLAYIHSIGTPTLHIGVVSCCSLPHSLCFFFALFSSQMSKYYLRSVLTAMLAWTRIL